MDTIKNSQDSNANGSNPTLRFGIFSSIKSKLMKESPQPQENRKSDKSADDNDAEENSTEKRCEIGKDKLSLTPEKVIDAVDPILKPIMSDVTKQFPSTVQKPGSHAETFSSTERLVKKEDTTVEPISKVTSIEKKNSVMEYSLVKTPEPSQETDYLYIQTNEGFRRTTREAFAQNQKSNEKPQIAISNLHQYLAVEEATFAQDYFHSIAIVVQGILAGLSLAHAFFAFSFTEFNVLIYGYRWLAIFAQAVFYVFFVISSVHALDTFEIGASIKESIRNCLLLQGGGLCILIYFCGSVCSVLMTPMDELITINNWEVLNTSHTPIVPTANSSLNVFFLNSYDPLTIWRWLSTIRASCAVIGWLIIAIRVNVNFTRDYVAGFMPADVLQRFSTSTAAKQ